MLEGEARRLFDEAADRAFDCFYGDRGGKSLQDVMREMESMMGALARRLMR